MLRAGVLASIVLYLSSRSQVTTFGNKLFKNVGVYGGVLQGGKIGSHILRTSRAAFVFSPTTLI